MTVIEERSGEHLEALLQRLRWLSWLGALALLLIVGSYWYTQLPRGVYYRELADNNRLRSTRIDAPRGLITDRKGRAIAENVPSYSLWLDRELARSEPASLGHVALLLGRHREELELALNRARKQPRAMPALIAEDLTLAEVARLEARALDHPELRVEIQQRRLYRFGPQTAHVLGHLGESDEREVAERELSAGSWVGRAGLERSYDQRLRGSDGTLVVVVDSRGRVANAEARRDPPRMGTSVELTLDLELQQEAASQMSEAGHVGAVVAIDPRDGAVRALYSSPSYDANAFSRRLAKKQWQELIERPHQPLQSRALHNTFPPGSVFKIVLATAGLEEGVIATSDRAYCSGGINLHGRYRRCHKSGGHGAVDLNAALRVSCDVYFYQLGQKLGIDRIARWAREFGFGQPSGVDLPGERPGTVPDEAYRRQRGTPWYAGETVSVAIGQGPILVSPMQMAVAMAALANGGFRVEPFLVAGQAKPRHRLPAEARHLEVVRRGLHAVVNDPQGTGGRARLATIAVAGKTGTAQVVEQRVRTSNESVARERRDHAWFASFAPYQEPELVVVVFVEHGGQGSRAAAPIAKAIYEKYFERRVRD